MSNNIDETIEKLEELLKDFKDEVVLINPTDLIQFAALYFTNLSNKKKKDDFDEPSNEYQHVEDSSSDESDDYFAEIMTDKQSKLKLIQSMNVTRQSIICEPFDPASIDDEIFEKNRKIFPKTPKQLDKIREILQTNFLFNCLDEEQLAKVVQSMFYIEVFQGDVVIKENDPGDNFYIIDYGTFTASNKVKTIYEKYDNEGSFGELALMYNCPRIASIEANSDGGLWAIDRITFRQLILKSAYQKRKRYQDFIKSVPILQELSEYDQCNLADALKTIIINNEKILTEGDFGDKMYFIEDGEIQITVNSKDGEKEVGRLKEGQYFGEVAIIAKIPRIANVYAVGLTKLAELDAKCYTRLMGPCIDLMRKHFTKYRDQLENLFTKSQLEEFFPESKKTT